MFVGRSGLGLVRAMEAQLLRRLCWYAGREMEYVVNTRSKRCSDFRLLATAPLCRHWFGTRNNRGYRTFGDRR